MKICSFIDVHTRVHVHTSVCGSPKNSTLMGRVTLSRKTWEMYFDLSWTIFSLVSYKVPQPTKFLRGTMKRERSKILRSFLCFFLLKNIWDKVFKNGPIKICGRQPLKNLKENGLLKQKAKAKIILRKP